MPGIIRDPNQDRWLNPNQPPGVGGPGLIDAPYPMRRPRGGVQSPEEGNIIPPAQKGPPQQTVPASPPSMTANPEPAPPVRQGFQYDYEQQSGFNPVSGSSASAMHQEVDPNQLMSTHLNSMLGEDSLYMRRARQLGIDQAASRGLGNSSIAAGNAMGSAIDRAVPIAGFDASRYGQVGDMNQRAENMMRDANANRSQQASQFNAQQRLAWDQFGHGQQMDLWNANRADRQLDSSMWSGMFSGYMNSLGEIYNNPDLSPEQQNAAAENLGSMYPGFSEQAWQAIPPGLLSGNAVPAAQMLPPMDGP